MIRTIVFLLATLIALPIVAVNYDQALEPEIVATLTKLVKIMLGVALTCFAVSEITRNYSQVDKLWSIIPVVYVWVVAFDSGLGVRLCLMASLVTLWAIRLTYNFARRGGYHWIPWKGDEDYRWAVLRQNPILSRRLNWSLFNLFFISVYQNTLILLFTLPTLVAWQGENTSLNLLDGIAALAMVLFIGIETLADQQQWEFHQEKQRRLRLGEKMEEPYSAGFCQTGLWARVRHPNYASEQAIWLCFYLFSVAATGRWLNWSLAGAILLMLLFIGSSDFSEKISAGKYPGYREYQKKTPRFLPKIF
jgi:steroid 5-alpha reductase family enzyme